MVAGRKAAVRPRLGRDGANEGVKVELLEEGWRCCRRAGAPSSREGPEARQGHTIKAIFVVQIDTASGVVKRHPAIRKAMDAAGTSADDGPTPWHRRLHAVQWTAGVDVASRPRRRPDGRKRAACVAANAGRASGTTRGRARGTGLVNLPRGARSSTTRSTAHAAGEPAVRPCARRSTHAGRGLEPAFRVTRAREPRDWRWAKWAEGQVLAFKHPQSHGDGQFDHLHFMQGREPQAYDSTLPRQDATWC